MYLQFDCTTATGTDIAVAAQYLKEGHCVAIPTETVYGLAANAWNEAAVSAIFRIKERPPSNPLIVHLPGIDRLPEVAAAPPDLAYRLLEHFAPGPLTVLLPRHPQLPAGVTAGLPHVAVRIPAHPVAQALLRHCGLPLAAPSANLYTRISPTSAAHVAAQLSGRIPYILDGGPCSQGIESTIVGINDGLVEVYRLGSIGLEALRQVAPQVSLRNGHTEAVQAPGMHRLHYAPRLPLIFTTDPVAAAAQAPGPFALINFASLKKDIDTPYQLVLSTTGDLNEAARNLYAVLHQAEALPVRCLIAEPAPARGAGLAINDRLQRAAHGAKTKIRSYLAQKPTCQEPSSDTTAK